MFALAMDSSTRRVRVSVRPPTGGSSFAMSTRETATIRRSGSLRRGAIHLGIGHMRRVRITPIMALKSAMA